jgi:hypothetical protein
VRDGKLWADTPYQNRIHSWRRARWKIELFFNTLLVFFSVLISLIAIKIVFGFVTPPPVQVAGGTYFTAKAEKYGWAYPPHVSLASHDPDSGEVNAIFTTNSEGWKDIEHAKNKPSGTYRILILGGSYTFGMVSIENLYTRQLERIFDERGD